MLGKLIPIKARRYATAVGSRRGQGGIHRLDSDAAEREKDVRRVNRGNTPDAIPPRRKRGGGSVMVDEGPMRG